RPLPAVHRTVPGPPGPARGGAVPDRRERGERRRRLPPAPRSAAAARRGGERAVGGDPGRGTLRPAAQRAAGRRPPGGPHLDLAGTPARPRSWNGRVAVRAGPRPDRPSIGVVQPSYGRKSVTVTLMSAPLGAV